MDKLQLHSIKDLYEFLQFDNNIQDSWKNHKKYKSGPYRHEKDSWINFDEDGANSHSLLLYRKGNHEAFKQLFSTYYSENSNTSFKPLGNVNWYIPYKDPVDKLLGGLLSSEYFNQKHHHKFVNIRHDFYKELEPILLQFVDEVLKTTIVQSHMYDNHITPLSVILENALIDKPQFLLGRLVGLNLDTQDQLYQEVYRIVIQKHGMSEQIFQLALKRRSPYGENKKHYLTMFKYNHANKIKELVHGPLYNEYKLVNFFEHHRDMKAKFHNG
jgi:hypothetical protein